MQIKIINQNRDGIIDCTYKDIRRRAGEIYAIEGNKLESISSLGKYREDIAKEIFKQIMLKIDRKATDYLVLKMPIPEMQEGEEDEKKDDNKT